MAWADGATELAEKAEIVGEDDLLVVGKGLAEDHAGRGLHLVVSESDAALNPRTACIERRNDLGCESRGERGKRSLTRGPWLAQQTLILGLNVIEDRGEDKAVVAGGVGVTRG